MKYYISLILLIPVCLYANIININHDGSGDYTTIQEGIDNANPGDTVLVHPGSYIETIDFLGKDIVVGSLFLTTNNPDYIEQTIIDGNQENWRLVQFVNGETKDARLAGFTITNAEGPDYKRLSEISAGLGIYINGASPSIENNRIINNHFNSWYNNGGGIVIENSSASIMGNTISANNLAYYGGGIYINSASDVIIENNTISDHSLNPGYGCAYGSGIYINLSQRISIRNNKLHNNQIWSLGYGGGIYLLGCEDIVISNNIITDNESSVGGGVYAAGSDIFVCNNLISGNLSTSLGGGIYCGHCDALLVNNTICNNQAVYDSQYGKGGGVAFNYTDPSIYNTILFANTAAESGDQVYLDPCSDPNFFYCDIEGGIEDFGLNDTVSYDGIYENNIDIDPHFLYTSNHPYALDFNSPCINAGNPDTTGLLIPEFDLAGLDRVVQGIIDIGAYENQSHVSIPKIEMIEAVSAYPNPTDGKVIISFPEQEFDTAEVRVEDLRGNNVLQEVLFGNYQELDFPSFKAGVYIMRIRIGKNELAKKLIVY